MQYDIPAVSACANGKKGHIYLKNQYKQDKF